MQRLWNSRIYTVRHAVRLCVLIGWLAAMFFLSNQPNLIFGEPGIWEFIIRKLAHMFEYGVLLFLIFSVFESSPAHVRKNLLWAAVFTVIFAMIDEFHQTFVTGRTGTIRDVMIDATGAAIAWWLLYMRHAYDSRPTGHEYRGSSSYRAWKF